MSVFAIVGVNQSKTGNYNAAQEYVDFETRSLMNGRRKDFERGRGKRLSFKETPNPEFKLPA